VIIEKPDLSCGWHIQGEADCTKDPPLRSKSRTLIRNCSPFPILSTSYGGNALKSSALSSSPSSAKHWHVANLSSSSENPIPPPALKHRLSSSDCIRSRMAFSHRHSQGTIIYFTAKRLSIDPLLDSAPCGVGPNKDSTTCHLSEDVSDSQQRAMLRSLLTGPRNFSTML